MRRAPLALGALGLLDLALVGVWGRLAAGAGPQLAPFATLVVVAFAMLAVGPVGTVLPVSQPPRSSVEATGVVLGAASILLPGPHLIALAAILWFLRRRGRSTVRAIGSVLVELAGALLGSLVFRRLAQHAAPGDPGRLSLGCLGAGLILCLASAVLVSLLVRYVDGVPFRQQPIWQPQHYARAQAFDLIGSLAAFLLLVSPWSLLFLGGPQLLLVGLLLKDAGSSAAAEQDAKTGLLNHPAFVSRARAELGRAGRHEDPLSLLVLDLDHLREINNRHGHPVGDLAIAAVADVLRGTLRAHDLAARVGGEEFLVLLPCTDLRGAMGVAGRIRGDLAAVPVPARGGEVVVTASVGVAQVEAGEQWESLYERADQALLAAKRAGRDRVEPAGMMALE